jgi:hypothetical protein
MQKILETQEGIFIEFFPYLYIDTNFRIYMVTNRAKFILLQCTSINLQVHFPSTNFLVRLNETKVSTNDVNVVKFKNGGPIPKLIASILSYPSQVITNDVLHSFIKI